MMDNIKKIKNFLIAPVESLSPKTFFILSTIYFICVFAEYAIVYGNKGYHHLPFYTYIFLFILICYWLYLTFQIFKKPEIGIPVIAFFLPFERIGSLYRYLPVNIRLSQVFVVITILAIIYSLTRGKFKLSIKKEYSWVLLVLFVIVALISTMHAASKIRAIEVIFFDVFVFYTYFLVTNLLNSIEILKKTIFVILGISTILAIFGIYQFVAGNTHLPLQFIGLRYSYSNVMFYNVPRVQGTGLEPLYWGDYLMIPIGLSFAILVNAFIKRTLKSLTNFDKLAIITFILCMLNIFFSFSRGAWYASAFIIAVILLFNILRVLSINVISKLVGTLAALIVLVVGIIFLSHAPVNKHVLTDRAAQIQDQSGRQLNTPAALKLIENHSLTGAGVGQFGIEDNTPPVPTSTTTKQTPTGTQGVNSASVLLENNTHFSTVSNEYLEVFAETGIFGLLTYAAFLVLLIATAIVAFIKVKDTYLKTILLGLIASFGGIYLQYISFSTIYIMHIWFMMGLMMLISYKIIKEEWGTSETNDL